MNEPIERLRGSVYTFEVEPQLPGDVPFWEEYDDFDDDQVGLSHYFEALEIFKTVCELVLDETLKSQEIHEAIFSRVSEEKIRWALDVTERFRRQYS